MNVSQGEMLKLLSEDGFDISQRELTRLRAKFRWMLRAPNGTKPPSVGLEVPGLGEETVRDNAPASEADADSTSEPGANVISQHSSSSRVDSTNVSQEDGEMTITPARKRRRMAAQAADPTKPVSRFPSEMTFNEARRILDLDEDSYRSLRSKFQQICSDENVVKKTVAGPERWEAVKRRLAADFPRLQNVFDSTSDGPGAKSIALDVLCTDVTKRMRMSETRMTLAQVKNVLGVNPEQSRALRAAFYEVLDEVHFTTMSNISAQQWVNMKWKWAERCALVKEILHSAEAGSQDQAKARALDLLAKDVVKRKRDEKFHHNAKRKDKHQTKGLVSTHGQQTMPDTSGGINRSTPPVELINTGDDIGAGDIRGISEALSPELGNVQSGNSLTTRGSAPLQSQVLVTHDGVANLPQSERITEPPIARGIVTNTQMGPPLLLSPNQQPQYMMHTYAQQPFPQPPSASGYHQVQPVVNPYAVYLRLHPSSSFVTSTSLWIATVQSQSLQELRQAAVASYPSAVCIRVEGVLKDGKGGELLLPIEQDQELAAYLAHSQGLAPTFCVQLAWKTS